jgi:hypothetical protein
MREGATYGLYAYYGWQTSKSKEKLDKLVEVSASIFTDQGEGGANRVTIASPIKHKTFNIIENLQQASQSTKKNAASMGYESNVNLNSGALKLSLINVMDSSDHRYAVPVYHACMRIMQWVDDKYKTEDERKNSAEALALLFIVNTCTSMLTGVDSIGAADAAGVIEKLRDFSTQVFYTNGGTILSNPNELNSVISAVNSLLKVAQGELQSQAKLACAQQYYNALKISAQNLNFWSRMAAEGFCVDKDDIPANLKAQQTGPSDLKKTWGGATLVTWYEQSRQRIANNAPITRYERPLPADDALLKHICSHEIFKHVYQPKKILAEGTTARHENEFSSYLNEMKKGDTTQDWKHNSAKKLQYRDTTNNEREAFSKSVEALFELSLAVEQYARLAESMRLVSNMIGEIQLYSSSTLTACHNAMQYLKLKIELLYKNANLVLSHLTYYESMLSTVQAGTQPLIDLAHTVQNKYKSFQKLTTREEEHRLAFNATSEESQKIVKEMFATVSAIASQAEPEPVSLNAKTEDHTLKAAKATLLDSVKNSAFDIYAGQRAVLKWIDELKTIVTDKLRQQPDKATQKKLQQFIVKLSGYQNEILEKNYVKSLDLKFYVGSILEVCRSEFGVYIASVAFDVAGSDSIGEFGDVVFKAAVLSNCNDNMFPLIDALERGENACRENYYAGEILNVRHLTPGSPEYEMQVEQHNEIRTALEEMQIKHETLEKTSKAFEEKHNELTVEMKQMEDKLATLKTEVETGQVAVKDVKTKQAEMIALVQEWSKEYQTELNDMSALVNGCVELYAKALTDAGKSAEEKSMLTLLSDRLNALIKKAQQKAQNWDEKFNNAKTELNSAISNAQKSLDSAQNTIKLLEDNLEKYQKLVSKQAENLTEMRTQIASLGDDLDSTRQKSIQSELLLSQHELEKRVETFSKTSSQAVKALMVEVTRSKRVDRDTGDALRNNVDKLNDQVTKADFYRFMYNCFVHNQWIYNGTDAGKLLAEKLSAIGDGHQINCVDGPINIRDLWDDGAKRVTQRKCRKLAYVNCNNPDESAAEGMTDKDLEKYFKDQGKAGTSAHNSSGEDRSSLVRAVVLKNDSFRAENTQLLERIKELEVELKTKNAEQISNQPPESTADTPQSNANGAQSSSDQSRTPPSLAYRLPGTDNQQSEIDPSQQVITL